MCLEEAFKRRESDYEMKLIIAVLCSVVKPENNLDAQAREDELVNDGS